jgi:ankyrin repeat protein
VNYFLEAILCGKDGQVAKMLKKYPKLALCEFYNGTTNPVCRATYLGHRNIVGLLLKYGADVNKRSSDQRTPLIWAAFRDDVQML